MLGKAFLSYRRSDAEWVAQSLYVQLRSRFGPGQLFMDVNSIEPGSRWPDRLRDELASSTIVVALVGPGWLRAADEFGRRRLDDPDDWVRCELAAALDDGKRILIVRAEDAVHPPAKALPEPLVRLASIQSTHRLHSASWPDDVNAIEHLLAAFLPVRLLRGGHRVHVCDGSALSHDGITIRGGATSGRRCTYVCRRGMRTIIESPRSIWTLRRSSMRPTGPFAHLAVPPTTRRSRPLSVNSDVRARATAAASVASGSSGRP